MRAYFALLDHSETLSGSLAVSYQRAVVAEFFDVFDWGGSAPDAEAQSAEDFLAALED